MAKENNTFMKRKNKLPIIMAFVLPIVIMLVIYLGREIFPFGNNMFLRSDMYHQYAPFMKEFQRNIQHGGSLLYSWNIGLGTNFMSTYAYYLASPTNWISFIFPDTLVPEFMNIMIILKAGLMSSFFAFYIIKKFKRNDLIVTAFGCFYAMSSYMAAFSWNVMWLDCLVLLPIILLGLEALVKEGKILMYTISLAVCIISNYYISIMICIFLVFYFIYLIVCEGKLKDKYDYIQRICYFVLYSILAGCIAMFIVLPAFFNLFMTASSNSSFPKKMTAYYNILEMLSKSVINTEPAVFSGHFPNIYSTMALFMLLPMYLASKRVPVKEKAGKSILLALLAFSFMFNIPTYIWHGMHFPNSLPCRYSFIFIFLTLTMGYQAVLNIRKFKTKQIVLSAVGSICAVFALQALYTENMTVENACIASAFILLYLIVVLLLRQKRVNRLLPIILLLVFSVSEIVLNTATTGYSTTSRTTYMSDNEDIIGMLEKVKDGSFFRTEKVIRRTKNDGAWLDYNSASIFSSTAISGDSDLYSDLGMQGRTNAYSYYGHTPVTQALLGVKYEIASAEQSDPLMTEIDHMGSNYLYQNKYVLPLGYMVNEDIKDMEMNQSGPFAYQNELIKSMTGIEGIFDYMGVESSSNVQVTAYKTGRFLANVTSEVKKITAEIYRNGELVRNMTLESLETPQIVDIMDVEEGDEINLRPADNSNSDKLDLSIAIMDYDKYQKAMEKLAQHPLEVSEFKDTYVKGTVEAADNMTLFTTVPYDTGWSVYVDGVKTKYDSYEEAFIVLELEAGSHTIEFKYWPAGLTAGSIISVLALLVFIGVELIKKRGKS